MMLEHSIARLWRLDVTDDFIDPMVEALFAKLMQSIPSMQKAPAGNINDYLKKGSGLRWRILSLSLLEMFISVSQ